DSYAHESYHLGALWVLGNIGGDKDARRLEAWITEPTRFAGLLEHPREDNFRGAFISLGMMWGRGSEQAEAILKRMVMREYWQDRDLRWWSDMTGRPLSNIEETLCWVLLGSAYGGGDELLQVTDLVREANAAALERLSWRLNPDYFAAHRDVGKQRRPAISGDLRLTLESTFTGPPDLPTPISDEAAIARDELHFKLELVHEAWAAFRAYASMVRTGRIEQLKYRLIDPRFNSDPMSFEIIDQHWTRLQAEMVGFIERYDVLVDEVGPLEVEDAWSEIVYRNYIPSGVEIDEQRRLDHDISEVDVRVAIQLIMQIGRQVEPPTGQDDEWYPFSEEYEPKLYMLRKDGVWYWSPLDRW
ncbi:MAG: hypothetical protein AAF085_14960, partial [Planctomycetota bacterium]